MKRKNNRFLVAVLLLVLMAGVLMYAWLAGSLANVRPNIKRGEEAEHFIDPPNKLNILVMGVDERPKEDDPGRSDTLLVMTIDTVTREASILSVPRDTRVRIKDHGWDKINHTFMLGGVPLTRQTVEIFLGIPVDYYAKVDLESFGRIVDAIGGVTIDVEKRMKYEDTWDHFVIDLTPGVQRLDGRTALQYVRYRDEEGDIGRVKRQQNFIKAVLAEINTPAIILKAPSLIREVFASLDTDMPIPVMLGLAHKLQDGFSTGLRSNMVEGLPYYIDDISYWIPDVMKTRQMVAEMQAVSFSGNLRDVAQRLAETYRRNLPSNAHLDDGSYYQGMDNPPDKVKDKPKTAPNSPPSSTPPTTKPKATTVNPVPGLPNKDVLPPKK